MIFAPHPYQSYCIERLLQEPALGLYIDMGLGKSVITLTAINELRRHRFCISKALIIAPKKVAEATWQAEASKWDHLRGLRISTVLGTASEREAALQREADVYVINRDNVVWLVEHCGKDWPFDMVVLDESTSFKSRQAKRFRALASVRPMISRIVELSGTPAPNSLLDLWPQVYLLDGGRRLGRYITRYRERYFVPDKRSGMQVFSWRPKPFAEEAIMAAISDICITMQASDYLQLPELIYDEVPVVLDAKSRGAYKRLEREAYLELEGREIDAQTAAVLSGKLLQLCNGAIYDDRGEAIEVHPCKVEAFMELIEGLQGQPVLAFYSYRHDLDRLEAALGKSRLRVARLTAEAVGRWNAGEIDVLLAHPASAAYGLNLQEGGRHVVWFGLTWSLEQYQQANARLHRQGQTRPVIVHHLVVQGSRDEDVMAALRDKDTTQDRLIQGLRVRMEQIKRGGAA